MDDSKSPVDVIVPPYMTVKQLAALDPAFSEGALRSMIFNARRINSVGKAEETWMAGCLVRVGRRILINVPLFYALLQQQSEHRNQAGKG